MAHYAGIDLGATNLRAAIADDDGKFLAVDRRSTPAGPTGDHVTEAVLDALRAVCSSVGVGPEDVRAVGIGSIGPLDREAGAVDRPVNLPETVETIPLVGPVGTLVDAERVFLHNDAIAGVVGERFYGDAPDDVVYLTVSSGIGAGVAVDGEVLSGRDGNAGEVGHFVVDHEGRLTCGCGRDGHWEAYCAGANVPDFARFLAEEDGDVDTALPLDDPDFAAADVFSHAPDDAFAAHVVDRLGHWNAVGVTNVVQAYAPRLISVGGAVALNNPEAVLDPVRERLRGATLNAVPEFRLTPLGEDVVLRGAVASALTGGTGDHSHS